MILLDGLLFGAGAGLGLFVVIGIGVSLLYWWEIWRRERRREGIK